MATGDSSTELEPPPLSLQKLDGRLFYLSFQLTEDKFLLHYVVNKCFKFDNVVWYIVDKGEILYCIKD